MMRVISNRALTAFAEDHPPADLQLQTWRRIVESSEFLHFADLKTAFNTVDRVGDFHVFDIGGNKYRIVAAIHFNRQLLFVRHVFTHREYDAWKP